DESSSHMASTSSTARVNWNRCPAAGSATAAGATSSGAAEARSRFTIVFPNEKTAESSSSNTTGRPNTSRDTRLDAARSSPNSVIASIPPGHVPTALLLPRIRHHILRRPGGRAQRGRSDAVQREPRERREQDEHRFLVPEPQHEPQREHGDQGRLPVDQDVL